MKINKFMWLVESNRDKHAILGLISFIIITVIDYIIIMYNLIMCFFKLMEIIIKIIYFQTLNIYKLISKTIFY